MGTVDFKTERTFDRRIGQRLELDGIDVINVSWVVLRSGRFGRRKAPIEVAGRIENVSVTGAGIAGPRELALQPGDEAVVRCGGRDNIVSIRHCEPTSDERTVRYGVAITSLQPNLEQRIRQLLDPTLTRLPVEAPSPGPLSLRGVARPATPQTPAGASAPSGHEPPDQPVPPQDRVDDPAAETLSPAVADPVEVEPEPVAAEPSHEQDDHVVLDLTDATVAAHDGAAVLDLTEPARPDTAAEPDVAVEPAPEATAEPAAEPGPLPTVEPAPTTADTPERAPHAPLVRPVHLPPVEMSEGRRVLDEVFGLMED